MKIGIDLDGVVVDFVAGVKRAYHDWYGETISHITEWQDVVGKTHFGSEEAFWAWIDVQPGFWEGLDLIPGALGTLYDLALAGHQIVFVTARHEAAEYGTARWLGLTADFPCELVFAKDKGSVDWQVLVEDSPVVLAALEKDPRPVIRFCQSWNRMSPGLVGRDWSHVHRLLFSLAAAQDEIDAIAATADGGSLDLPAGSQGSLQEGEEKVVDLMAALEESLASAKAHASKAHHDFDGMVTP